MKIGYCLHCGAEIAPYEYEEQTHNIVWEKCPRLECQGHYYHVKTDEQGFVFYPMRFALYFLLTRHKIENR